MRCERFFFHGNTRTLPKAKAALNAKESRLTKEVVKTAKATEITVDIRVNIPDDTICRCLRILEMWMDDHPDGQILVNRERDTDGAYHHTFHIDRGRT